MRYPIWMNMLPQTQDPAGGGAGDPSKTPTTTVKTPEEEWDAFLAGVSAEVRAKFDTHTTGLKSALTSEREKSKGIADKLKKLAELELAETKRKESELSEAQKAAEKLSEFERKLADAELALATTRIRSAVEVQASALGFNAPEDAYQMADLSAVEIDDDGKVKGVEDALKALVKAKPYLLKAGGPTKGAPEIDSGRKSTTQQPQDELINKKRRGYTPL